VTEVSCRAFTYFEAAAAAGYVDLDELLVGCPLSLDVLRTPTARVPWDDWAVLCDRFLELVGPELTESSSAELIVSSDLSGPLRGFAASVTSAAQLYRMAVDYIGPMLYRPLQWELEKLDDGRLRFSVSVPDGKRASQGWMLMAQGALAGLPRFLDAPDATIAGRFGPRGGTLEVAVPPSRTLWNRMALAMRALQGGDAVARELAFQQRALLATEASLKKSESTTRAVLNAFHDLVLVLDGDLNVVDRHVGSPRFADGLFDTILGRPFVEYLKEHAALRAESLATIDAALRRVLLSGAQEAFRFQPPATVTSAVLEVEALPFVDGQLLLRARDVGEQVRLQRQVGVNERMASMGQLAAGVAHEINNPLTYVSANLQLLQADLPALLKGADPEAVSQVLELIDECRQGATRVRDVVSDLSRFSRVTDDSATPIDVGDVLKSAISMSAHTVRHHAVLHTDIAEGLPAVMGDETRFGQVIVNLLVNAAQALQDTSGGQVFLAARAERSDDGQQRLVITVEDNGPGIPPDDLGQIFTPFFTTKQTGQGTGLGLSISHRTVTDMGGTLVADNLPTGGARFVISLPVAPKTGDAERDHEGAEPQLNGLKILVIEDEPIVAGSVRRMLAGATVEVTLLPEDGRDRLLASERGAFDVIICDLMMPILSGMQLYSGLPDGHWARDRFLFMTGGAVTADARSFLERHVSRHIAKPFQMAELRRQVRDLHRAQLETQSAPPPP
jgi:signal transduction histidine kinase/CheY-like chemotaxis protein